MLACSNTKIGVKNKKMDMDEARILEGQTHRHTRGHNSMTQKIMKMENMYNNTLLNQRTKERLVRK